MRQCMSPTAFHMDVQKLTGHDSPTMISLLNLMFFIRSRKLVKNIKMGRNNNIIAVKIEKFPDFSLTFVKFNFSLTKYSFSLTFPWPWKSFGFHWLFTDRGNPVNGYWGVLKNNGFVTVIVKRCERKQFVGKDWWPLVSFSPKSKNNHFTSIRLSCLTLNWLKLLDRTHLLGNFREFFIFEIILVANLHIKYHSH